MSSKANNGVVVGRFRLLVVSEPGKPSLAREAASAVVATVSALLGGGEDLETRSFLLRVSAETTGAVVAERRFRSRRSAEAARERAIARYTASHAEGRPTDWQALLDAVS